MANELVVMFETDQFAPSATAYAIIRNSSFQVWDVVDTAWETWSNAQIDNYDIALTNQGGDMWTADFPSGITQVGTYRVQFYALFNQFSTAVGPSIRDQPIGRVQEIQWAGSEVQADVSANSVVNVVNIALTLLGEPPITSIDEDNARARQVKQRYPDVRDYVQSIHPWNSCATRASLAKLTSTPEWGFSSHFQLPSDFLRLVRTQYLDRNFKIEKDKLLADVDSINIIYNARISDPTMWSEPLKQAIATRLALEIALPITQSTEVQQAMFRVWQEKLPECRHADASEGPSEELLTDTWINSRLGATAIPYRAIDTA